MNGGILHNRWRLEIETKYIKYTLNNFEKETEICGRTIVGRKKVVT